MRCPKTTNHIFVYVFLVPGRNRPSWCPKMKDIIFDRTICNSLQLISHCHNAIVGSFPLFGFSGVRSDLEFCFMRLSFFGQRQSKFVDQLVTQVAFGRHEGQQLPFVKRENMVGGYGQDDGRFPPEAKNGEKILLEFSDTIQDFNFIGDLLNDRTRQPRKTIIFTDLQTPHISEQFHQGLDTQYRNYKTYQYKNDLNQIKLNLKASRKCQKQSLIYSEFYNNVSIPAPRMKQRFP